MMLWTPLQHIRSTPIIREPFRRMHKSILCKSKLDIEIFNHGLIRSGSGFVRMELNRQATKARLDRFLRGIVWDVEKAVEIWCGLDLIVGFVESVEEVGDDDGDVDCSPVSRVPSASWNGFGVAGADEDGVESRLDVAGDESGEKIPAGQSEELIAGHGLMGYCLSSLML